MDIYSLNNNCNLYTGNKIQPDVLTTFIKTNSSTTSFRAHHIQAFSSYADCIPIISSFTAIPKIIQAVSSFFTELSQSQFNSSDPHLNECFNALKNFIRGCVSFIPVIGNITLIIFDTVRMHHSIEITISSELENRENVAGIAADGKILFLLDFDQIRTLFQTPNNENQPVENISQNLSIINHLCHRIIERYNESESKHKIVDYISAYGRALEARARCVA